MKSITKINLITLAILQSIHSVQAEEAVLDEVSVVEHDISSEKKIFTEAKASSTKQDIFKQSQSIDNIVRSMPGAFTQQDKSTGVVALNIRGESGFGRANTMVDGVSQTFYATASDGNGRAGGNAQFGAAIDPNFIAGVDLTKGTFSGASGANALFGSANFRTLGVNDVVDPENNVGVLFKGLSGTNDTKPNFMGTFAARKWLDNGYIGFLYGYSQREVAQNYKVGGGSTKIGNLGADVLARIKQRTFNTAGLECDNYYFQTDEEATNLCRKNINLLDNPQLVNEATITSPAEENSLFNRFDKPQFDVRPIDPESLRQRSHSHLVKFEYADDIHSLNLQYRQMNNHIGIRKVENQNYQADYQFKKNDYLNLSILAAYNDGKQRYPVGSEFSGWPIKKNLVLTNKANTLDVHNIFNFFLPKSVDLQTTVGVNLLKNRYDRNRFPEELALFYQDHVKGLQSSLGGDSGNFQILPQKSTPVYPNGEQRFNSFYLDNSLSKGIFKADYSVNLLQYRFNGDVAEYYKDYADFVKTFGKDSKAYQEAGCSEDLQTCREIYEPLVRKGGKRSAVNHSVVLSANVKDYFSPFVSFSRTHRMPNIQEMYFSQIGASGTNLNLKPEKAKTYQIGFNSYKKSALKADDVFGLKVVYYQTRIDNYIHNAWGYWWDKRPDWSEKIPYSIQHRNYRDAVHKKGVEIELNYDVGRFFTNFAYAYQVTNQPTNYSDTSPARNNVAMADLLKQGNGLTKVSMLPKDYARLEMGSRWFDQRLVLGGIMRYYGKSKRATLEERYLYGISGAINDGDRIEVVKKTEEIRKQPMIYDVYVSYEPIKNLVLKAELQNIFNKKYVDPLDAGNDSAAQRLYTMYDGNQSVLNNYARGRTAIFTANYKY